MCSTLYNQYFFQKMNRCKDVKGFYKHLELDASASMDAIKKQYRAKAKIHHPDRETGDEDTFKTIQEAYDVLSDPDKRHMYNNNVMDDDMQNMQNMQNVNIAELFQSSFAFGFGEMFESILKEQHQDEPPPTRSAHATPLYEKVVSLTLDDLVFGGRKEVVCEMKAKCNKCDADGFVHGNLMQCLTCQGRGYIDRLSFPIICNSCNGEAILRTHLKRCTHCDNGFHTTETSLSIPFTPGQAHNSTYHAYEHNLVIRFKHALPPKTKINGHDIYMRHPIYIEELLVGFTHRHKTYTREKEVTLSHSGYFDASKHERMHGRGIHTGTGENIRGDLIIQYSIEGTKYPEKMVKFKRAFEKIFSKSSTRPTE